MQDRVKLTKRYIDAQTPDPEKERWIWDSEVRGLFLRIYQSGEKRFAMKFRIGRQQKVFTIGTVGSPWTIETAREHAKEQLRDASLGVDPQKRKAAARAEPTVSELIDRYLKEGPADKPNKRAATWEQDRSSLHSHIRPLLGSRIAAHLKPSDLAKAQSEIAAGKTAVSALSGKKRGRLNITGGKTTASRCTIIFQAMMAWAVSRKILVAHPTLGVVRYKIEKRERFISVDEVQKIFEATERLEKRGEVRPEFGLIIRLLILTGARRGEIQGLQWREVDLARRSIVLPDARSKTGARRIPLSDAAIEVLEGIKRNGDYVFPANRANAASGHTVGLPRAWRAIRDEAGLDDLRIHDLRHSFASFAAEAGASLQLIGKALGHTQMRTTERYAHLRDDPLHALVNEIGERVQAAKKG
ncbi:tyrosine-type recombinase/integrase [Aquidulcibacter paucihalophilus]|uniref:tyrosine-type recombinase/integrase n=1 Tax=Aquidulcibacter paucihalophilus TaxID=1978549 RepID=UPI000A194349|nr:site-specific integrase [Aquidulcibacter paucihalophilus]